MKKRFFICLLTLSLMFFSSCGGEISETVSPTEPSNVVSEENTVRSVELDYFSAGRFSSTIVEDEQNIYYAKTDGIYKKSKTDNTSERICIIERPDHLLLYEDKLFFSIEDGYVLCSISKNGTDLMTVLNGKSDELPVDTLIFSDYEIVDDVLYILNAAYCVSYNLITFEAKEIIEGTTVEIFQIIGDDLYYIDHSNKTFTIYKLNLKTLKKNNVIGEGESEPQADIYFNFLWVEDSLYYCKRNPTGLFYRNKDIETFVDDADIGGMFSYNNEFYYVSFDRSVSTLYKFDENKQACLSVATLKEFNSSLGLSIVDGYAYFNSGFEQKIGNTDHILYDYSKAKPTVVKLKTN